jgi:hypothetical protein
MGGPSSELEAGPILGKPRTRSISEMPITDGYEPAPTHSPGDYTPLTEKPDGRTTPVSSSVEKFPSLPGHLTGIAVTTEDEDIGSTITVTSSPGPVHIATVSSSPPPSCYPGSDISISSPPPSSQFQHPLQAYSRITPTSYSRSLHDQHLTHSGSGNLSMPLDLFEMGMCSPQQDTNPYQTD